MAEKEYIERETLKILFAGACAECRDSCAEFDGIEADCNQCLLNGVIKDAKSIPAADVRPAVRGKWEEHNYDPEYLSCDFSCSECNLYLEEYYFGEGQWPGKTDHYFCPNCGADMRETEDEKA